ncbi:acetoacetate--CoA ligase [Catenovulum sp. SM1970]|uniref:acetoacetate--CoA ligase n=1 Tax=Marinifaba aquimaris TaxID=2741323 RepID=UPI001571A603|nr:acetoacetate--CoA ligase [Marinifaba aquimaris]NTS78711.1 acetoacetate--CoA ligase [Marinifaba aquimaris]
MQTEVNPILWQPNAKQIPTTQISLFIEYVNQHYHLILSNYHELHQWSINKPADFWQASANFCQIKWHKESAKVFDASGHMLDAKWFVGAELNFAENLLSRKDDAIALVDVNEAGNRREISYRALYKKVAQLSHYLKNQGIEKGDRIAAVMPNQIETVIIMLATASLGAVFSSCSPDFGSQGLIDRLAQLKPKALFTVAEYQYNGKLFELPEKIDALCQELDSLVTKIQVTGDNTLSIMPGFVAWQIINDIKQEEIQFTYVPFDHPAYILFSSGTTGKPKCIMHSVGGTLLQHSKEIRLHANVTAKDTLFYFTTCGWMMWNWLVSGLQTGCKVVLFDGNPMFQKADLLFELAAKESITHFGTSARYLKTLEQSQFNTEAHDLTALKTIMSTGSVLQAETFDYVYQSIKSDIQLSSISGGTDIISCFALGCPILPVRRGELQCKGLGMAVDIFDEHGQSTTNQQGELVCTQAFPSMPIGFWRDEEKTKYRETYFANNSDVWSQGDFALQTDEQALIFYGRSDATLNPGGVRIGTAEIYRQLERINEVLEGVAIGQQHQGDERVLLFVTLREQVNASEALTKQIKSIIKTHASPRHVPELIHYVSDLPRTRNGKVAELTVKDIANNRPIKNTTALANPESIEAIKRVLTQQ